MALVNCPDCRKEVSSNATTRPSCGYEITFIKRGFVGKLIKYIFIVFNLLMRFKVECSRTLSDGLSVTGIGSTSNLLAAYMVENKR